MQKLSDELSDVSRQLKILQEEKNRLLSETSSDAQQKSLEVQSLEQASILTDTSRLFQSDNHMIP